MKKRSVVEGINGGGDGRVLSVSLSVLCCVLVVSAIVVLCVRVSGLTESFGSFMGVASYSKPPGEINRNDYFNVPILALQTKVNGAGGSAYDQALAISSDAPLIRRNVSSPLKSSTGKRAVSKWQKMEEGLARARDAIRKAASTRNLSTTRNISDRIYRNPQAFHRSYLEMERRFKVYVYEEGDSPIVHNGPCKNIYASEGRFISEMEEGSNKFRTRNPYSAHVYFMPFSVTWMVKYLYKDGTYDLSPLKRFVSDYVRVISTKHPFWNRTQGADHFMLSCHDWGPHASQGNADVYNTSIRALCNANSSEGFNPQKDVSLPEINLYTGNISPKLQSPLPTNLSRSLLAFFAGGVHGPIRPILLHHWNNQDPDIHVSEYLPKNLDYYTLMLQSKFCLCPSGHEVASPRVVEAIYAECIPVILSENYVLPFSDVLDWDAFSIRVSVPEIPRLKEILAGVREDQYLKLKEGVKAVRRHFVFNQLAQRYDVFHMILHSVWLRRINLRIG